VDQLTTAQPPQDPLPAAGRPETVRLRATSGFSRVLSPRELWRYRDLALQIAARDITVRYRQTALGAAWAILQPIGFMVVFTLFFGRVAGIASNGIPYALFSLSGLVAWTYFANGILLGAESLVTNSALVSKIYFPRIFMPAGVLAAGFVDLGISLVILFVIVFAAGFVPSAAVLALPLLVAIMVASALGVAAGLSALNVRYRDVRYVIPFAIQMWLFATPIAYPSSLIEEPWRTLSAINPMVGVVEGFRWATLGTGDAPLELIGISALASLVLLAAGLAYFDRVERTFADHI
jgi:lipopolysaccharide transport system permease protein